MLTRRDFLHTAAASAVVIPSLAHAQSPWPVRDIHAICGTPPGSGADIIVRFYAKKLQDLCGRSVIVENRPGAFGNIATEYVARSKPDGYTIFIAPSSSYLGAAPSLFKKLNFDPLNDFEHVAPLLKNAWILSVSGDSPHKTAAELTAYLKAQGDKASYGSLANTGLISSELYKAQFGLKTVEVKYKATATALNDLWAGNLAFIHIDPTGGGAHFKSGKLRPLAMASAEPLKAVPNVPGAREAGILNSDVVGWWSVVMPKGTPTAVLDQLETWFSRITADPETQAFLTNIGCDPLPGNRGMLRGLLEKEIANWREYVKIANIEVM
jgi:tripartite-type tricarboxylate transporter receptor subunit TctC